MSSTVYKKIQLNWDYAFQPTTLQVGTVKIVRSKQPFTQDNFEDQLVIDYREYDPTFTTYEDSFNIEEDTTYFYMIIVYGDIAPEIYAPSGLYSVYVPFNRLNPSDVKPMILSYQPGTSPIVRSHSPLKIDWGSLSLERYSWSDMDDDTLRTTPTRVIQETPDSKPIYEYSQMLNHLDGYIGNRIRITHADGFSPIDAIYFQDLFLEQWYSGGYSSFKFDTDDNRSQGLCQGLYVLPETPPPRTSDLSYMFASCKFLPVSIEKWDMRNVRNMSHMFSSDLQTPLDLSKWNTPLVQERPSSFYIGEIIQEPSWGVNNNPVHVIDNESMIISGIFLSEDPTYIYAKTPLTIKTPFYLESILTEVPSLPFDYVYEIRQKEGTTQEDLLRFEDIYLKPLDGASQIESFGCSSTLHLIKQWWVGGYKGFANTGVGASYMPETLPSNTTDISYLAAWQNLNSTEISRWDVSSITNMFGLFRYKYYIHGDLSKWNVSNVEDMSFMFENCTFYGKSIESWDVSSVKNMTGMFAGAGGLLDYRAAIHDEENIEDYYYDLTQWCVGRILSKPIDFDARIQDNVRTDLFPIWGTCPRGEIDLSDLEPETEPRLPGEENAMVVNSSMGYLYVYSTEELLVTSQNTSVSISLQSEPGDPYFLYVGMPTGSTGTVRYSISPADLESQLPSLATSYVEEIIHWCPTGHKGFGAFGMNFGTSLLKVPPTAPSNTTNFNGLFAGATNFNQNISKWEVSNAESMNNMFSGCSSFSQDLSGWCVSRITRKPSGFDTESLLATTPEKLPIWGTCPTGLLPPAEPEEEVSINLEDAYVLKGMTSTEVEMHIIGKEILFEWGTPPVETYTEGPFDYGGQSVTSYFFEFSEKYEDNTLAIVCTDPTAKLPLVSLAGMKEIVQWYPKGHVGFSDPEMFGYIGVGRDIEKVPENPPANTPDLSGLFIDTDYFNDATVSNWDVSNVTNMDYMFSGAKSFAQDLSGWCVTSITEEPEEFNSDGLLPAAFKPSWGMCPLPGTRYKYLIDNWEVQFKPLYQNENVRVFATKETKTSFADIPLETLLDRLLKTEWGLTVPMVQYAIPGSSSFTVNTVDKIITYQEFYWDANNNAAYRPKTLSYNDLLQRILLLVEEESAEEFWYKSMFNNFLTAMTLTLLEPATSSSKVIFDADLSDQFTTNSN